MSGFGEIVPGRLLIAGLGLALVAIAALTAGYLTSNSDPENSLSPRPNQAGPEVVRGIVQSVSSDSITLQTDSGPITLKLTPMTRREALQRTSIASVQPGDWVNAGGVRHSRTLFVVNALAVIPAANLEAGR
jgi:hypothetical protein